jgi:hypothetical protein
LRELLTALDLTIVLLHLFSSTQLVHHIDDPISRAKETEHFHHQTRHLADHRAGNEMTLAENH